jgi:hypothetical protein
MMQDVKLVKCYGHPCLIRVQHQDTWALVDSDMSPRVDELPILI